jgi:hypothetical protein
MTLVMYMKKGAPENKVIKLVYDFYENEFGIVYDADHEVEVSVDSVLSQLPTKINDRASVKHLCRRNWATFPLGLVRGVPSRAASVLPCRMCSGRKKYRQQKTASKNRAPGRSALQSK